MSLHRIVALALLASSAFGADKLALTMKTRGDAKVRPIETQVIQALKRGTSLFDGDLLTTGEDGLAIIVFLDDKSQLKIKSNSEMEVTGTRGREAISKRINLSFGTMKASIEKQKGEFVITTPVSVASVKGTEFWLISSANPGDIVIGISGTVELTNNITGETTTVQPGQVVESTDEGELNVLVTVKIQGTANSEVMGGQFGLDNVTILDGDVEAGGISGIVTVSENTVFEGANVAVGLMITITGILDSETGNVAATLIEVAAPITIEAIVSSVTQNQFTVSNVSLIEGEAESLPTEVVVTENTVVEGAEVVQGARVTVTGNFNEETGLLEATHIVAEIPQLRITGTVSSASENEFEIENVSVEEGDIDPSYVTGAVKVVLTDETQMEGTSLSVGKKVSVTGSFEEDAAGGVVFVATSITVFEKELLFELEDSQGNRKDLIIRF